MSPATAVPDTLEARFRWARRSGHPGYVWPEVPIADWRASLGAIEAAVRSVLAGESGVELVPPGDAAAEAVGIAAFTSGTGPLLGRWSQTGIIETTAPVAAILAQHLEHGRRRADRLDAARDEALAALATRDVPAILLKGTHTAHVYFEEPGVRPMADIDIAVAPEDVDPAAAALSGLGYSPSLRSESPYRCDWIRPNSGTARSLDFTHVENPIAIELHGGLARDFFGVCTVTLGPVDDAALEPVPGSTAFVLAQPLLLGYLALHASEELHRLQLLRILELARVARADFRGDAAWQAFRVLAREHGLGRFLFPALALTETLAPGTIPVGTLKELEADAPERMRRVVNRLTPATAQRLDRLSIADGFLWARGPRETLRRAAYLLWPAKSGRDVKSIYADRFWRLVRGRVGR